MCWPTRITGDLDTDRPEDGFGWSTRAKCVGWLQLLRIPNLLTVPGDPIAGALLASVARYDIAFGTVGAMGSAATCLLLYSGGLLHNDYCDIDEDRRDRPLRPLPSGVIEPRP